MELYRLFVEANANTSNDDRSHDVDIGDGGGCDDNDVGPTRDTADVTFSIQDGEVMVRAHMLILKLSAPTLAPLCEGYADDGENATVPIMGISSSIFRLVPAICLWRRDSRRRMDDVKKGTSGD